MTIPRCEATDAWANLALPGTLEKSAEVERLFRQARSAHVLDRGISGEETVAMMDRAGMRHAVVTVWHTRGSWQSSDDKVREMVRRFPGRFVGAVSLNPERPRRAVDQLRAAVEQHGFKALRLVPWLYGRPPSDPRFYPLYAACVELGIPLCTQVGHTGPLMSSEPGRPIPYLERVAIDFPDLRIVGGHLGYPWTDEMIALAAKFANVHIDTSAHLPKYYPTSLLQFMRGAGRTKVLFATNFPMLDMEKCRQQADRLDLPDDSLHAFLGGNARRVFKL